VGCYAAPIAAVTAGMMKASICPVMLVLPPAALKALVAMPANKSP